MKIEKRPGQEAKDEEPTVAIESQEDDPMIGLERAAEELTANAEKLDGLSMSEGGADLSLVEGSEEWATRRKNILEGAKDCLRTVATYVGEPIIAAVGGLGAVVGLMEMGASGNVALGTVGGASLVAYGVLHEILRNKGQKYSK